MHLVMFDLDGTLVDSTKIDTDCYLQALVDIFGFDLDRIDRDWGNYPHITDAGILSTLCSVELGRLPTKPEIDRYQSRFLELLYIATNDRPLLPIDGAIELIKYLQDRPDYAIAIATGAWQSTAKFKLDRSGFGELKIPIACSDDAPARVDIMQCAHDRSLTHYQRSNFTSVTYVGDGVWDSRASQQLDYHFIGIGTGDRAMELSATGAKDIIPHYRDLNAVVSLLGLLQK
jgi:phosphoglycolate phosphatase-like HAD superfamily hydrolase